MKRYTLLIAGGLLLTGMFSACTKSDSLKQLADISFYHTYDQPVETFYPNTSDTVIPLPIPNLTLPSFAVATNINQIAKDYNTTTDKLVSVKIDSLILSITTPPNLKLDFVDNIKIFIFANGQPEVLAAEKSPFPGGQRAVALDVRSEELKPYFQQDTVYLRVEASFNGIPPATTKLNIRNVVKVVANPLN